MTLTRRLGGHGDFQRTLEELHPRLVRYVGEVMRRRHGTTAVFEAQDVVQEALVVACENEQRFRGRAPAEIFRWLRRSAENVLLNVERKWGYSKRSRKRVDSSFEGDPEKLDEVETPEPSPEEELEAREVREKLLEALGELTDVQAQIVKLMFFEEKTAREVGRTLERDRSAVHKSLKRALQKLRGALRKLAEFEDYAK